MSNSITKEDHSALKDRILAAAIEEFGKKGYETASTNVIVNKAGVSKGLLFHYFGSKKKLFLECNFYVLNLLSEYMAAELDIVDRDLFSFIKKSVRLKLKFYKEHPELMSMANKVWYSKDRKELLKRLPKYAGRYSEYDTHPFLANIDRGKLREDIEFNKIVECTALLIEACWLRFNAKYNENAEKIALNMDEFLSEIDMVIDLIEGGAYWGR